MTIKPTGLDKVKAPKVLSEIPDEQRTALITELLSTDNLAEPVSDLLRNAKEVPVKIGSLPAKDEEDKRPIVKTLSIINVLPDPNKQLGKEIQFSTTELEKMLNKLGGEISVGKNMTYAGGNKYLTGDSFNDSLLVTKIPDLPDLAINIMIVTDNSRATTSPGGLPTPEQVLSRPNSKVCGMVAFKY